MLRSAAIEIGPAVEPRALELYTEIHSTVMRDLGWLYRQSAIQHLMCFESVNKWIEQGHAYPPFQFIGLGISFDREVLDVDGNPHKGQDTLVIQHPAYRRAVLGIDVAEPLFGHSLIDEPFAVLGDKSSFEQAYTRRYRDIFPGIQVSIDNQEKIWAVQRQAPERRLILVSGRELQ